MQVILLGAEYKKSEYMRRWAFTLVNSAIVLVLLVVLMGGWTRINDAGLSCPDWPGCFGQISVPNSVEQLDSAAKLYPHIIVEAHKSWLEMIHRYLAGTLSLLILALAVIAAILRNTTNYPVKLSFLLLVLVGFQAARGMWTVTLKLLPIVVTAHLFFGLLTTVLLLVLRDSIQSIDKQSRPWARENYAVLVWLILLFVQVVLGGWTSSNYAGWGCSDWLACNPGTEVSYSFSSAFSIQLDYGYSHQGGSLALAERGAIQIIHRIGALAVVAYFFWLYFVIAKTQVWSQQCAVLLGLTVMQIVVGLMNIAWAIPSHLAMAHHLLAVLMLIYTTRLLSTSLTAAEDS